jgi:hypothetical protein
MADQEKHILWKQIFRAYPRAEAVALPALGDTRYGIIDRARNVNAELSDLHETEEAALLDAVSRLNKAQPEKIENPLPLTRRDLAAWCDMWLGERHITQAELYLPDMLIDFAKALEAGRIS